MELNASLLAIGPFSQTVADCLSYATESYDGVPDGTIVLSELFVCPTDSVSRELASAVGAEPWDFTTHNLDPEAFDWDVLAEMHEEDVVALRQLVAAGFRIMFQPG